MKLNEDILIGMAYGFGVMFLLIIFTSIYSIYEAKNEVPQICFPSNVSGTFIQTEQNTATIIYNLNDEYQRELYSRSAYYFTNLKGGQTP